MLAVSECMGTGEVYFWVLSGCIEEGFEMEGLEEEDEGESLLRSVEAGFEMEELEEDKDERLWTKKTLTKINVS